MTVAKELVSRARSGLIMAQPFFGRLSLRLRLVELDSIPTLCTDGVSLFFNPTFVCSLSRLQIRAVVAHEVLHCALGHVWRVGQRDKVRWNLAADMVINDILKANGFALPAGCPHGTAYDPSFAGKGAEYVYAHLRNDQEPEGGQGKEQGAQEPQGGQGKGQGALCEGGCMDHSAAKGDTGEGCKAERDWATATIQAARACQQMGNAPAGMDRQLTGLGQPRVDWRAELHEFIRQTAREDYTWRAPSTRYLHTGVYLPSVRSEHVGPILIAIDTSGSIGGAELSAFCSETLGAVESVQPSEVHVLYVDAEIARTDVFQRGDVVEFRPAGGGGTDFRPAFHYIDNMPEPPVCVLYFTDLCGTFPKGCEVPTLWVTPSTGYIDPPFGRLITIEKGAS